MTRTIGIAEVQQRQIALDFSNRSVWGLEPPTNSKIIERAEAYYQFLVKDVK